MITLSELKPKQKAHIVRLHGSAVLRQRLTALGILKGQPVEVKASTLWGDPRAYTIGYQQFCLRNSEADCVEISVETEQAAS